MGNSIGSSRDTEAARGDYEEDSSFFRRQSGENRNSVDPHDHDDLEHSAETTGLYNVEGGDDEDHEVTGTTFQRALAKLKRVIFSENWLFLVVLGVVAALVGFGIDAGIYYLYELQVKFANLGTKWGAQYALWVTWSVVFSALAILPIILISANASGTKRKYLNSSSSLTRQQPCLFLYMSNHFDFDFFCRFTLLHLNTHPSSYLTSSWTFYSTLSLFCSCLNW